MGYKSDTLGFLLAGFMMVVLYSTSLANDIVEVRNAFKCDDCAFRRCPVLKEGCELVREPGICSCCLTCARKDGENCGINLGRCGRGFQCRPKPDDPNPLLALLEDTAVCQPIAKPLSYRELIYGKNKF